MLPPMTAYLDPNALRVAILLLSPDGDSTPQRPANLFQLSGDGLHISFPDTSLTGQRQFMYQDVMQTLTFAGNEISVLDTDLGSWVGVTIRRTVDAGTTTFTLLNPRVNVTTGQSAYVHTIGITALHRFSLVPALNFGQAYLSCIPSTWHGRLRHVLTTTSTREAANYFVWPRWSYRPPGARDGTASRVVLLLPDT
jgi:hypothetical protein